MGIFERKSTILTQNILTGLDILGLIKLMTLIHCDGNRNI